jgi:hypothetical protein
MEVVLNVTYEEFIDLGVRKFRAGKVLFLICDGADRMVIPSTKARSTVRYIGDVDNCEVLAISNARELIIYLSKLEVDLLTVPRLFVWNSSRYQSDLILSKLLHFEHVTIGEPTAEYHERLSKWSATISVSKE